MKEIRVCQHCLITPKYGQFGTGCERLAQLFGGQNPEGRCGRIIFAITYILTRICISYQIKQVISKYIRTLTLCLHCN